MIFAVPFHTKFKYADDESIEFNINYKPEIKKLYDFIEKYQNHKINLHFFDYITERDLPILKVLNEKFPSSLVAVFQEYTKEIEQEMNENNITHYYQEYIDSFDRFNGFLTLNVTDIFVANELCFSLKDLSEKAKEKNIRLRAYCNVAQSSWGDTPAIQSFFIRPEDIDLYSNVLDVVEFFIPGELDGVKLNALYEIYAKDKKWEGPLRQIIFNFNSDCDNRHMVTLFGPKRLNCHKKCSYQAESKHYLCRACTLFEDLSKSLKESNLIVTAVEK